MNTIKLAKRQASLSRATTEVIVWAILHQIPATSIVRRKSKIRLRGQASIKSIGRTTQTIRIIQVKQAREVLKVKVSKKIEKYPQVHQLVKLGLTEIQMSKNLWSNNLNDQIK